MLNPKTPGVYVQELSLLPPSVAPVATAIPAFIGYTEKRGEGFPENTPKRITSLIEYEEIFGGPYDENYTVTLTDSGSDVDISVAPQSGSDSPYLLYYAVQHYFANGGGPCHIISVGLYDYNNPSIDASAFTSGVDAAEQEDEPTLLLVPEAVDLATAQRADLHNQMLAQCNKMQDRFALMDVLTGGANPLADATVFRGEIGTSYLKYGAAYYPSLKTTISRHYRDTTTNIADNRSTPIYNGEALTILQTGSGAGTVAATATITVTSGYNNIAGQTITVGGVNFVEGAGLDFEIGDSITATATAIAGAINGHADFSASADGSIVTITSDAAAGVAGNSITLTYDGSSGAKLSGATFEGGSDGGDSPNLDLYNRIKAILDARKVDLYPSAAMAGIYARVDRNRGVWKAPANVSVNMVEKPNVLVTSEEQELLNVDPNTGKSVNVIRPFAGKGILVWGARTLSGNDNEWRYVPVRRLFIFVEESIQKASEPFVFEPNDANTWVKVKGMIENFLSSLWREGALAGAAPSDAFFVKVGLGETMSSLDILEGRLNVEVGIAAVRPAEFIILKFSHKLQES
jgi:hypothetical protein